MDSEKSEAGMSAESTLQLIIGGSGRDYWKGEVGEGCEAGKGVHVIVGG